MKPPKNTPVFEIELFHYWTENDNLLVNIAKDGERTMENAPEFINLLQQLTKRAGKKICILGDVTNTMPLSKEMREYYDEVLPEYVTAIAMYADSKMGNAMAFIYKTMHGNTLAVRLCDNEQECREWLKVYLSPDVAAGEKAEMKDPVRWPNNAI
jgi:hypothetical protein